MRRKHKIAILSSLFVTAFAVGSLINQVPHPEPVKADGEWELIDSKFLAKEGVYGAGGTSAYVSFTMDPNDYSLMTDSYKHSRTTPYYLSSDYNFLTHIELSTDGTTYIPLNSTNVYDVRDLDYFFKNGRFRINMTADSTNPELAEQNATYLFIKVLAGCEFPSWDYCANGGTKKKYIQKETTISKRGGISHYETYSTTQYTEYVPKRSVEYTGIAAGWNNANYGTVGFNELILSFGQYGVDYLADDHKANTTNQAKEGFDVGDRMTINGLPMYKINQKYPDTKVGYDHGNCYFYVHYPVEVLLMNKNTLVPTIHIPAGTEFMDVSLPEVTLKLVGGCWAASSAEDLKNEDPYDFDTNLMVKLPHKFGTEPHAIFNQLPANGCKLSFTINTGEINLESWSDVINFDGLYSFMVSVYPASKIIQLIDRANGGAVVLQTFNGFIFAQNTDYTFEFDISCGAETTFKFAINHFKAIDYTLSANRAGQCAMWVVDTTGQMTMEYYKELETYKSTIQYGGSSSYEFLEGDPVYNFENVVNAFDLYDDTVTYANLSFVYEDGAVTDGKYNAGTWTLLIKLTIDGKVASTKNVTINVHGKVSKAKIYYDDADPIEVPVGSKLVPPPNPSTYREGDYDYVFDGWYFEGAKWDFENDVVQGDMHLVSRFVPTIPHYIVTVNFEGVEMASTTYSLTKGSSLPFDLFEMDGATYEVYLGHDKITSLVVQNDITITVRYTVVYTYFEAVEPTCTEDGHIAYWYSPVYGNYYFADPQGREIIPDPFLPKLNHNIIHLPYHDSSCHELGNVDCYYCQNCHKHFEDENGQNELINWSIAKKPHVLTHHAEVPATCTEEGYVEHWTCANEPGVYYGDEACSFTLDNIIISAIGHDYRAPTYTWVEVDGHYECRASILCTHCHDEISETQIATGVTIRQSTCSQEGQASYSVRFTDTRFSAQTKIITLAMTPHHYVFVSGIEATKAMDGLKEHYECSECHKYFVKNGENYSEVQYSDLVTKYKKGGCGGSIAAPSLIVLASAGALSVLLMLRRKEDR